MNLPTNFFLSSAQMFDINILMPITIDFIMSSSKFIIYFTLKCARVSICPALSTNINLTVLSCFQIFYHNLAMYINIKLSKNDIIS
jgi:hypothetical protein